MKKNEEKQEITQSTMKVAEDLFMMEVVIRCKSEMMRPPEWAVAPLAAGGEGDDDLARRSNRWKCEYPYTRAWVLRENLIARTKSIL